MYQANTALYSTTDPRGPDAEAGVITASPPGSGFQLCGAGGVIGDEVARRLGLVESGLVTPFDREAALAARETRNKATYGTASGRVAEVVRRAEAL